MRKAFLAVLFSLFIYNSAYSASTADITVKVTVRFLSVSIVDSAEYSFGVLDVGDVAVATSQIVVKNESNCAVSFQLKLTNPAGWTAISVGTPPGEPPGVDQYMLSGIFRNSLPVEGDFVDNEDAMTINFVLATGEKFAKNDDAEGEKGYNVVKDTTRNLWLRFYAPSGTNVKDQQLIPVTVKAVGY